MKFDYFNIDEEDLNKWVNLCPPGEFRVYSGSLIDHIFSPIIPPELYKKYTSVIVVGATTDNGTVYYMANGNRVDSVDSAIDQMPLGLAFIGNNTAGSACLIQHGNWPNRTIHPTEDFWRHIEASGTASYFPLSEMPIEPSGKISELKIDSQNAAFGSLVHELRNIIDQS